MNIPKSLGWLDKQVRHQDGRKGRITGEFIGFGFCVLTITCEDGSTDKVQRNSRGPDAGSRGWEWLCEGFHGGERWILLGDHND